MSLLLFYKQSCEGRTHRVSLSDILSVVSLCELVEMEVVCADRYPRRKTGNRGRGRNSQGAARLGMLRAEWGEDQTRRRRRLTLFLQRQRGSMSGCGLRTGNVFPSSQKMSRQLHRAPSLVCGGAGQIVKKDPACLVLRSSGLCSSATLDQHGNRVGASSV